MSQKFLELTVFLLSLAILRIQTASSSLVSVVPNLPLDGDIKICPSNLPNCNSHQGRVILHKTLFPADLRAYASLISSTVTESPNQLTFTTRGRSRDVLIKVPLIQAGAFEANAPLTVRISCANNVSLATNRDNDISYALTDGTHVIGYFMADTTNYNNQAPCQGAEGILGGNVIFDLNRIDISSPLVQGSPYPGRFDITIKLNEGRGFCYTAQQGGVFKSATYSNNRRLAIDQGISLLVFKDDDPETYGIHLVEVDILIEDQTPLH